MVSPYIEAESAAVRKNREIMEDKLDRIWERVNALGCSGACNPIDKAYDDAIGEALTVIEAAGGKDPIVRRLDRESERAGKVKPVINNLDSVLNSFGAKIRARTLSRQRLPYAD